MTPIDPAPTPATTPVPAPREPGWYIPWVVLGIVAIYLLSVVGRMNPPSKPFDLAGVATLPVVDGGRVKPLETVARVNLRLISQREYFVDENGNTQPAIKWYMDVLAGGGREGRGSPAWKHKVFRIENDQLLRDLDLKAREGLRYSLDEFGGKIPLLMKDFNVAQARKEAKKPIELRDEKLLELFRRLKYFEDLSAQNHPLAVPPREGGGGWESLAAARNDAARGAFVAAVKAVRASVESQKAAAEEKLIAAAREADDAKAKRDSREEDRFAPLLDLLSGGGNLPTEPRVLKERFDGLLKEKVDDLGEQDLQQRFAAYAAFLPDAEAKAAQGALLASAEKRLAERGGADQWVRMIEAYRDNKPEQFNTLLKEYREKHLGGVPGHDLNKARGEAYYNRFAPFYHCTALYVLVFLLCAFSWFGHTEQFRRAAFYTLYVTLIIHTAALVSRMYFQDRWSVFVTNLYSSAVFIGWGCVVLGLLLEKLYPIGIGNLVAAVLGVGTTIISHNLGAGGDTLEMMQAVLDTNFWLATHVTTVTFGYTATFVAGFIGIAFIARMLATVIRDSFKQPGKAAPVDLIVFGLAALGLVAIPVMIAAIAVKSAADFEVIPSFLGDILTFLAVAAGAVYAIALLFSRASAENFDAHGHPVPGQLPGPAKVMENMALDADASKKLTHMIYGVVCFATLLSFVGTVLGGIWADQSWGRFWGWDPKENGAVLIVIWNALILHARWCGLVRGRGLAVLAVAGNMVTAWSWFGTNQLSVGLHNYGFDDRLAKGCSWFWMSQLVIIGLGLIPRSYWSGAARKPAPAPAAAQPGGPQAKPAPNGPPANGPQAKPAKWKKPGKRR